ncbi:MAG: CusA/CzcA family heavy metal efflux RND transporter [Myxococcota bacterium]|nr:CusA/CzcA family heavy metal efflux RND transporter [Deltaproteobacteria bacterium]MCP4242763.1 efflux RND transporter permease subunit [bacterium]MDP7075285.1 CusA/CzcA family heavy metal efflux RND transporter [Myxococcota bacterium]MDP7299161.1 CusA/CzcA family heavy metal efflux RND transporter [Myxococcota bacterium]MDP7434339.1 CusA/CzcA family heavy metal efflux RND transporter [Myxococcota bacterium]
MLEKIIEASVRNQLLVLLFTATAIATGLYAFWNIPIDALPDVSDVQVIVFTEWQGQPPQIVEDQVTYPITTTMLSVANARVVRGYSFFGLSFVYVIFNDGTDVYWARSRVLEYLSFVQNQLPPGVTPVLGPDATPVGWIFEYALIDRSGKNDLSELRSIQDWYVRYQLLAVPGVANVATAGGFVKQYQVTIDPNRLLAYDLPLATVVQAIRRSNNDVGGRVVEYAETEYMVEGIGYIEHVGDVEKIPVGVDDTGTPILIRDIADVGLGPDVRRGAIQLDTDGEAVIGIIEMRYWNNALAVINAVKEKLKSIAPGLPEGVEVVPIYDRSALIARAQEMLNKKLLEESIIVAAICAIFLLHLRSAFVAIFTLPVGILIAIAIMYFQGLAANIMSLGGIAIAIGAMVDGAIVMIENAHKHLERDGGKKPHWEIIVDSSREVGPALFFSLMIIAVSFLPVFALTGQSGRMFSPLAFTKTYAMASAAVLAITVVPVLMGYLIRGRIPREDQNPINRFLIWAYRPLLHGALRFRWLILGVAIAILVATYFPLSRLGSEFIPPLNEGDLLYMPSMLPGVSIAEGTAVAAQTNRLIMTVPEVKHALAKLGRARTPLDPAPLEMLETTVILKPKEEWRKGMTIEDVVTELDDLIVFPGVTNAWTMPIKTRIDMLSTGIKTPVGIKITGPDLSVLEEIGKQIEPLVRGIPGTRSVYAERVAGGYYLSFVVKRLEAARYGLTVQDVLDVIQSAIGGMNVTTTIEGLERYPLNVRYSRELRDSPESLRRVLLATPTGAHVPLGQVADIFPRMGPPSIKTEGAQPQAWIYVDINPDQDLGGYVDRARTTVDEKISLPPGYTIQWSGQYEYMEQANARLKVVLPITLIIIFLLLYLNFQNVVEVAIVMLALPFAVIGGIWFMWLLDYNLSVAVMVGFIALSGVATEIGVVMILYLDHAYEAKRAQVSKMTTEDLYEAVTAGAVERVRPIVMTASAVIAGLLPIMWSDETGARVMKRIAAPMVGGMLSATILALLLLPIVYEIWRAWQLRREAKQEAKREGEAPAPAQ